MWVSIVTWAVVVMSWFVRIGGSLAIPSRPGQVAAGAASGKLYLVSSRFWVTSGRSIAPLPSGIKLQLIRDASAPFALFPHIQRLGTGTPGSAVRSVMIQIPILYFAVPPTLAFFILHRRDRRLAHRLKHTLCTRCGYSRAGIAEGAPCPECGGDPANTRT